MHGMNFQFRKQETVSGCRGWEVWTVLHLHKPVFQKKITKQKVLALIPDGEVFTFKLAWNFYLFKMLNCVSVDI